MPTLGIELLIQIAALGSFARLLCKCNWYQISPKFQASSRSLFKGLHFWLLLHLSAFRLDPLLTEMETLNIPLDSHVTLARSGSSSNSVLLQDLYTFAGQPLTVTTPCHWSPGRTWPPAPRRDDFNNVVLKTGVTVSIVSLRATWLGWEGNVIMGLRLRVSPSWLWDWRCGHIAGDFR